MCRSAKRACSGYNVDMPKIVDHDARRAELAQASYRLLCERGYDGASMRQVAKAAGVSTGTLYHYFPDKSSILIHAFTTMLERDEKALAQITNDRSDLGERFSDLFVFVQNNRAELTNLIRLAQEMVRYEPGDDTSGVVAEAVAGYRSAIARTMGIANGPVIDTALSMLIGVLIQDLLDPQPGRFEFLRQVTTQLQPLLSQASDIS